MAPRLSDQLIKHQLRIQLSQNYNKIVYYFANSCHCLNDFFSSLQSYKVLEIHWICSIMLPHKKYHENLFEI